MFSKQITHLQQRLREQADPAVKAWWEGYVKDSAPFMGVKMPAIRAALHPWHRVYVAGQFDHEQQFDLALSLFNGEHSEEKLAGTLFLQEILFPAGIVQCKRDLDRFAGLFEKGKIYDWNICDWFCVKVLGPLIESHEMSCAERISTWRNAANLWQARASVVAFVNLTETSSYYPLIEESCQVLIRKEERFAKTAVGWILREISKTDEPFVHRIIDEHIGHFSSESLNNAAKYFPKEIRSHYRSLLKSHKP
jgi:3-methyladenine DNA glycosylase AlkD